MREYKFRGKRIDNGEWVYGFLIQYLNGWFICNFIGDAYQYEVDPSTVGQFTGLKDKNGKEIYEGDILSIECYSYEEPEDEVLGNVTITVFGNALIVTGDSGETECLYLSDLRGSYTTIYEVIGNIYENPELLSEYCGTAVLSAPESISQETIEEIVKAKIDRITREIFIFEYEAAEKVLPTCNVTKLPCAGCNPCCEHREE